MKRGLSTRQLGKSLTVMPARESIESLVSLKLSHRSAFALDMKLAADGLASKELKLLTTEVASSLVRHVGFGQPVVVVVVLVDVVELLELEVVDVVVGEAVEFLEVVEKVTEVMVALAEEDCEPVNDAVLDVLAMVTP